MYTLIGYPQSRAMRVMWMLEELGLDYEFIPAKPRSAEITALNPTGKIPALRVGDRVLTDSVAIVTYLADLHGALTFPCGTLDRAEQDGHTHFLLDEMDAVLWTAAKNSFLHPKDMRVPEIKPVCRIEFDAAVDRLAGRLGDGPWLMGESFTIPDLIAAHCIGWAKVAKFEVTNRAVLDHAKRAKARPAFRAALARAEQSAE